MEKREIIKIILLTAVLIIAVCSPPGTMKVFAGNTLTVTFNPDGNVTVDVSPASLAFGTVYVGTNSYYNTSATNYTMYNNGSVPLTSDVQITDGADDMGLDPDGTSLAANSYALRILNGTVENKTWLSESEYRDLDNSTAAGGTDTFGIQLLLASTITSNWTTQTVTITIQVAPV